MEPIPEFVAELKDEGLTHEQAVSAAQVLAGGVPPAEMFAGALWGHDLKAIKRRIDAGESTNEDAALLHAEIVRLNQIIGWQVHDPGVRAALNAARSLKARRPDAQNPRS